MGPETESSTPIPALPASGDLSGSPFQGPGAAARVAPFAAVAALAEASLALPPGPQSAPAAVVSVLLLLAVPLTFLLPWPRLPAWATVFVPLLYTGSVLALILAAGATSGVGIVVLVPLVWTALFHRRWESGCVVAAIVAVEVVISLTPVAAAGPVIARRVLLWALLSTLISVATHGLRDRIGRAQAEREQAQDRLRELSVMEDRDRIAAELRDNIIQRVFAAGLSLQGAADLAAEPEVRRRVGTSVEELDDVVRMLRNAVFGLEHRPRRRGLRQELLGLCGELSPMPEISFGGQADSALSGEAQAQVLELLRETLVLIEPDTVPGRVEVTVDADACLVVIDAASGERRGAETGPERPEQDFSGLLDHAAQAGARVDIQTAPGGIRVSWRLPLSTRLTPRPPG
jgi:signal transduction histidine kinase